MFPIPTAIIFANPYADVILVLAVVLLFFGPKRLPALGRDLGRGMREFKDSISSPSKPEDEAERPAITGAAGPAEASADAGAAAHPKPVESGSERGA